VSGTPPPEDDEFWAYRKEEADRLRAEQRIAAAERKASRWATFTDDELFGIYSIVSGHADRIDPNAPLAIMRNEAVAELERRRVP
jgi:hypothetical protein